MVLFFLIIGAHGCEISASFGGSAGGSSAGINEELSAKPDGSYSSKSSLSVSDNAYFDQGIESSNLNLDPVVWYRNSQGDYASVYYNVENPGPGTARISIRAWGKDDPDGYAAAQQKWTIGSADVISFKTYAENRLGYEAEVTTDIANGGIGYYSSNAKAKSSYASASQTLDNAWGDEIIRTASANNGLEFAELTEKTTTVGGRIYFDLEDEAKATPLEVYPQFEEPDEEPEEPIYSLPSYLPTPSGWPPSITQWPTGLGWPTF